MKKMLFIVKDSATLSEASLNSWVAEFRKEFGGDVEYKKNGKIPFAEIHIAPEFFCAFLAKTDANEVQYFCNLKHGSHFECEISVLKYIPKIAYRNMPLPLSGN